MYRIRREDVPVAVPALDELCFPDDDRVKVDGALWWIAWHGQSAVGYAGMRICQNEHNKGLAFLCRVGVVREHRGHGLQRRMLRARESAARAMGVRELVTYCVPWNCASINSLASCGYKAYRPEHTSWGGSWSVYWRKKL